MTLEVKRDAAVVEKWTPERRRQQTRDLLVDAAAQVFARRGFEAAALEEIAEVAGYSRGAIYKNFGGKEELFLAVNQRMNERALAHFGELVEELGASFERSSIPDLAAEWRRMFLRDAEIYVLGLEFNLYVLRHPELKPKVVERSRQNVEMIAAFMEEQSGKAGVALPYPAPILASLLASASDGFQLRTHFDPEGPDLIEPFLDLFMRALSVSSDATGAND